MQIAAEPTAQNLQPASLGVGVTRKNHSATAASGVQHVVMLEFSGDEERASLIDGEVEQFGAAPGTQADHLVPAPPIGVISGEAVGS